MVLSLWRTRDVCFFWHFVINFVERVTGRPLANEFWCVYVNLFNQYWAFSVFSCIFLKFPAIVLLVMFVLYLYWFNFQSPKRNQLIWPDTSSALWSFPGNHSPKRLMMWSNLPNHLSGGFYYWKTTAPSWRPTWSSPVEMHFLERLDCSKIELDTTLSTFQFLPLRLSTHPWWLQPQFSRINFPLFCLSAHREGGSKSWLGCFFAEAHHHLGGKTFSAVVMWLKIAALRLANSARIWSDQCGGAFRWNPQSCGFSATLTAHAMNLLR